MYTHTWCVQTHACMHPCTHAHAHAHKPRTDKHTQTCMLSWQSRHWRGWLPWKTQPRHCSLQTEHSVHMWSVLGSVSADWQHCKGLELQDSTHYCEPHTTGFPGQSCNHRNMDLCACKTYHSKKVVHTCDHFIS